MTDGTDDHAERQRRATRVFHAFDDLNDASLDNLARIADQPTATVENLIRIGSMSAETIDVMIQRARDAQNMALIRKMAGGWFSWTIGTAAALATVAAAFFAGISLHGGK